MIRNVVFDLGNVLISFRPEEFLKAKNYPENTRMTILADVFGSREWLMLDNGDITTEEAIMGISSTSSLSVHEIGLIFAVRHEILYPLTRNIKILPELKKAGFRLYYLSNFPADLWEHVTAAEKAKYDFFGFFDGGIISAEARASKPEPGIYNQLLSRYGLKSEECLYIDDLEANVNTAVKIGMHGMVTFGSTEIEERIWETLRGQA
jgi:glucose-1-phosphatase